MNNITGIDITTTKMISFVKEIGLPVEIASIDEPTFLPGIQIINGGLKIDHEKLLYPGDILHEAGHLAVTAPGIRKSMNGTLVSTDADAPAEEMMSIAWSYAACMNLDIDPAIVFHENGYKGGANDIVNNFSKQQYVGVPMLQWIGLCYEPTKIKEEGKKYYPQMIKWLRE